MPAVELHCYNVCVVVEAKLIDAMSKACTVVKEERGKEKLT